MDSYIALICDMVDFGLPADDTADELIACYIEEVDWLTAYPFSAPKDTPEEIITRVARGIFFENDWTMSQTVSTVIFADQVEEAKTASTDDDEEPESILEDDGSADIEVDVMVDLEPGIFDD